MQAFLRNSIAAILLVGQLIAAGGAQAGVASATDAPIPASVAPSTRLVIGDPTTEKALILSGLIDKLPFKVEWANISGGPLTIEAFRAGALDIGSVADIPPIHATWTGVPVKVVAARFRRDPVAHPIYELGIAPGVSVKTLADLKGKRIAYSPGQAQGALVLRALQKAELSSKDVDLVELPSSTGDVYANALGGNLVDVAPLGGAFIKRYLANYGRDGGTTIAHGLRDDPGYLYVPAAVLADPNKAAAIAIYVGYWAHALAWVDAHPKEWAAGYYVADQGLSPEDAQYLIDQSGNSDVPGDWTPVIERQQQTIDLLAKETGRPVLKAEDLFDRRFEHIGGTAFAASPATAKTE